MSKPHEWGDKTIVVLESDQIRRHKTWCSYYNHENGSCPLRGDKCTGSAHCDHYRKRFGCGPVSHEEIPDFVPFIAPYNTKEKWLGTQRHLDNTVHPFQNLIPGRSPDFGEKLIGKLLICLTGAPRQAEIGIVVEENLERIIIETDSSKIIKYNRTIVWRQKALWII